MPSEIERWHNSAPLKLDQLHGKVVPVDFWTYSCINCIHTIPYVNDWYRKYHDQGLVVVGVHTPEYPFEYDAKNIADAVKRFGIQYPVAQANPYDAWRAYGNQYWPALYLIDANGKVVYTRYGEGGYDKPKAAIRGGAGGGRRKTTAIDDTGGRGETDSETANTRTSDSRPSACGFPMTVAGSNLPLQGTLSISRCAIAPRCYDDGFPRGPINEKKNCSRWR